MTLQESIHNTLTTMPGGAKAAVDGTIRQALKLNVYFTRDVSDVLKLNVGNKTMTVYVNDYFCIYQLLKVSGVGYTFAHYAYKKGNILIFCFILQSRVLGQSDHL